MGDILVLILKKYNLSVCYYLQWLIFFYNGLFKETFGLVIVCICSHSQKIISWWKTTIIHTVKKKNPHYVLLWHFTQPKLNLTPLSPKWFWQQEAITLSPSKARFYQCVVPSRLLKAKLLSIIIDSTNPLIPLISLQTDAYLSESRLKQIQTESVSEI